MGGIVRPAARIAERNWTRVHAGFVLRVGLVQSSSYSSSSSSFPFAKSNSLLGHTTQSSDGSQKIPSAKRTFSSTTHQATEQPLKTTSSKAPHNPRWFSDLKARIGKCIFFGLTPPQTLAAAQILKTLTYSWRELLAGSEGFLTSKDRAGLYRQRVVWGDMDCMSHVNNVTYNKWAESARIEWAKNFALFHDNGRRREWEELWSPRGEGLILRSIRTDYKFPMTWPDRVTVFHKLRDEPTNDTDSFILDVMIISERMQRPAARCVEDIVVYDYRAGKKTTLRPYMAAQFKETFLLQEESKARNLGRIEELVARVRQLELESWDRDDAVEDVGGAGVKK